VREDALFDPIVENGDGAGVPVDRVIGEEDGLRLLRDDDKGLRVLTTPGRVLFNEIFPAEMPYKNELLTKKGLANLVNRCADEFAQWQTAEVLDRMKDIGFEFSSRAGV